MEKGEEGKSEGHPPTLTRSGGHVINEQPV
jgi:hypothetical protein